MGGSLPSRSLRGHWAVSKRSIFTSLNGGKAKRPAPGIMGTVAILGTRPFFSLDIGSSNMQSR